MRGCAVTAMKDPPAWRTAATRFASTHGKSKLKRVNGLRAAPRSPAVGSQAAGVRDGPPGLWHRHPLDGLPGPGPQPPDRAGIPQAQAAGLLAVGTPGADAAVAA